MPENINDSMENPLQGLDISALGTPTGATGSSFEVRDVEDTPPVETPPVEDTTPVVGNEGNDPVVEDTPDTPFEDNSLARQIGIRDGEGDEGASLSDDTDDDPNAFFKAFADQGIIALDEDELSAEEDRDIAWLLEKASAKSKQEIETGIEDYKESLPAEIKSLLDNYDDGVPLGALLQAEKEAYNYDSITDDSLDGNEDLQKKLIAENLFRQGESEEDIKDMLVDYEDSGLLEKQAARALTKIRKHETFKKEQLVKAEKEKAIQDREQYNEWLGTLKEDINKRDEIIPGLELNEKQKKELYNGITKLDKNGENAIVRYRRENPDFDLQVAYLATIMKGDFSSLVAAAETKATRNLKEKASSNSGSGSSKRANNLKGMNLSIARKALNI